MASSGRGSKRKCKKLAWKLSVVWCLWVQKCVDGLMATVERDHGGELASVAGAVGDGFL